MHSCVYKQNNNGTTFRQHTDCNNDNFYVCFPSQKAINILCYSFKTPDSSFSVIYRSNVFRTGLSLTYPNPPPLPPPPRPLPLVSNPSIVDNVLSVILILVLLKVCNQFISFHLNDKCATLMPRVEIVVPRVEIVVPRVDIVVPRVDIVVPRVE